MRSILSALVCVVAALFGAPAPAHAQDFAGTPYWFDHDAVSAEYVETYQLCVDAVSDAACQAIGTVRIPATGVTDSLTFTLPPWVPNGRRELWVRAKWKAPFTGYSAPTNSLVRNIVGPPRDFRTTAASTVTP